MNLKKLTVSFWAIFAVIALSMLSVSCSDTETTDPTGFAIYYTGMTDIGPSMVGTISSPTYKGAAPSDFAITGVTLNGEPFSGNLFEIDPESGKISIVRTEGAQTGLYSISISCMAGGQQYNFPNMVSVKMMAAAPEGIVMTPNLLTADYGDVIDINSIATMPTAQITTEGEHISITGYEVGPVSLVTMKDGQKEYQPLNEDFKNCFSVTKQGEFSIIQGGEKSALLEPGVYSVAIIVHTKVEESILENAVEVKITSKPLELVYAKNEGKIEEKTSDIPTVFHSVIPTFKGSTDGLKFAIHSVTPATDKIKINETNGQIYVEDGHGFKEGEVYEISVIARNAFNTAEEEGTVFDNVFTLQTVGFIQPISEFYYGKKSNNNVISRTEMARFEIKPKIKGDEVLYKFELPKELINVGLTFNENDGSITAIKGNKAPLGDHQFTVIATNPKNSVPINVTLTIKANPNKFTYIHYGNNLGEGGAELEGEQYQNQFRFYKANDFKHVFKDPKTDYKGGGKLTWKITKIHKTAPEVAEGSNGGFTIKGWNKTQMGIVMVEATAGDDPDTQVTVRTPLFVQYCDEVDGYTIEYSPMVLHVNPKTGGASAVPVIKKNGKALTEAEHANFWMDYRRTFNYYNNGGVRSNGVAHEDGQPSGKTVSPFMVELWDKCNGGKGSKLPVSYFVSGGDNVLVKAKDNWNTTLGYVDNGKDLSKRLTVNVVANQWNVDGWANGFMVGQMTFKDKAQVTNKEINNGSQIFPFVIWFDENYEK